MIGCRTARQNECINDGYNFSSKSKVNYYLLRIAFLQKPIRQVSMRYCVAANDYNLTTIYSQVIYFFLSQFVIIGSERYSVTICM